MHDRIAVTAVSVISALGRGVDEHLNKLKNAESGLKFAKHLYTVHAKEFLLGEVDLSNDELSLMSGLETGVNGYTRTALLALIAMEDLLKQLPVNDWEAASYAFINANTVGGMNAVEQWYPDLIEPGKTGDFTKYINTLDCAESTETVTKHFGLHALIATISTACSSSANAILLGARYMKHGIVKRAICGGCDSLSKFTLNGFSSLKNVDKEPCKPFDQNRNGLNLGEGAAFIMLEFEQDAIKRGANIIGYLSGYGNTNDAFHPTAPSPEGEGAHNAMKEALNMGGLSPSEVGYVNVHGTATQNNDVAEGKAMQNLFEGHVPHFSSTKPFTGHTLAAAGAIEAIFSLLSLQQQSIWPNLNFTTPMEDLTISPVSELLAAVTINHCMSNSFGFGGNNVSLLFSKA